MSSSEPRLKLHRVAIESTRQSGTESKSNIDKNIMGPSTRCLSKNRTRNCAKITRDDAEIMSGSNKSKSCFPNELKL